MNIHPSAVTGEAVDAGPRNVRGGRGDVGTRTVAFVGRVRTPLRARRLRDSRGENAAISRTCRQSRTQKKKKKIGRSRAPARRCRVQFTNRYPSRARTRPRRFDHVVKYRHLILRP